MFFLPGNKVLCFCLTEADWKCSRHDNVQYEGVSPSPVPGENSHLSQEVFPVDDGHGVALQLNARRGRHHLFGVSGTAQLMVGALNPVATKLRQQDQWEWTFAAQHLVTTATARQPIRFIEQ